MRRGLPGRFSGLTENYPRICAFAKVQTKLDILRHSIRNLQTCEELHIVFTRYLRCDGIYRFLSAGGNDRYGGTR